MSDKVLVTYASYTGSTAGIAEAIASTLTEKGFSVEVRPMKEITDLTPYRAVVAGSPIHKKMWLPEAMQFVQTHREQLSQKPFAAFLSCLTLAMKNQKWVAQAGVENWLAPVRAQVTPVSEGRFAGTLELKKIPSFAARLGFRISVWTGVWKEGDHRDWQAIRVWAEEVAVKLRG